MLAEFIEAALRSLVLALLVWAGLRVFRIRNVVSQRCAWTAVLIGSLLMPFALRLTAHWRVVSIAAIPAPAALDRLQPALTPAATAPPSADPATEAPPVTARNRQLDAAESATAESISAFAAAEPSLAGRAPASNGAAPRSPAAPATLSLASMAILAYFVVAAAMLLRLLLGFASALRLWNSSTPVDRSGAAQFGADFNLRFSGKVFAPVTIGSGVVLPANYASWSQEKLRIVLAHERSHVRQRDFHVQMLASLYTAMTWFSPLGWWLKHKLSELAEAISDRSGLEEASSRSSYAQILLEFAAAPRPTLTGVAMARTSNLSHRIERLFNDRAFRQAFAANRRTLVTALLVATVMFAATALVKVRAASQAPEQTAPASTQAPVTGQSHADEAQPAAAPDAAQAPAQPEPSAPSGPSVAPSAASGATPAAPVHVEVPAIHVHVPAVHVDVPAQHIDVPAVHVNVPATHVDVPAQHVDVPAVHVDVPATRIDVPGQHIDIPAQHIDVPPVHVDVPAIHIDLPASDEQGSSDGRAAKGIGGELLAMLDGFGFGHARIERASPAPAEATFDRTLSFNGKLDLHVATGSGDIHLTRGSANEVKIHARVHSQDANEADEVQKIAANPPIEQSGNTVRIGAQHERRTNHISIDYDIEAPADAALQAESGSGNINDDGVGEGAKLETGSGNIMATGLEGGFKTETGSGNIAIENTGEGDAKAETGSGRIEVKGVRGALTAETGSGEIKAEGTPSSPWKLEAGSGSIELATGGAAVNLDASTGSGEIKTDRAVATEGSSDHHHIHAQLNGGGPEVRVETGSGDIRIE